MPGNSVKSDNNVQNKAELTKRQQEALPHLISNSSISEGCRSAGIGRDCYYRWLEDPAFKAELERLRGEMLSEAVEELRFSVTAAVKTLASLCIDETAPHSVRRGAAGDVLSYHLKWREVTDFEERLSNLERRAK